MLSTVMSATYWAPPAPVHGSAHAKARRFVGSGVAEGLPVVKPLQGPFTVVGVAVSWMTCFGATQVPSYWFPVAGMQAPHDGVVGVDVYWAATSSAGVPTANVTWADGTVPVPIPLPVKVPPMSNWMPVYEDPALVLQLK